VIANKHQLKYLPSEAMPQYSLKVTKDTVFKSEPVDSSRISDPNLKVAITAVQELPVHSYRYDAPSKHFLVAFLNTAFNGKNTWYVYADHVQLLKDGKSALAVKLNVPWFSQLDNQLNPTGACNVTSVAMCLNYLGLPSPSGWQLEDEFYQCCEDNDLSRHSPVDLAKLIAHYGYKDNFQSRAKWDDVKQWLNNGNPVIVHGWFTDFGHIMPIIGYNDDGWIVNDPNGKWLEARGEYDTNASGAGRTYSYGAMEAVCGPDAGGELWIHFVSK
jgi:uncharacterized protein YvpB